MGCCCCKGEPPGPTPEELANFEAEKEERRKEK
uniref:Uncharacterized protein n=1 Tax=Plectus sambesii TaxID=2011161 RepID=A0A914V4L6_9BILA